MRRKISIGEIWLQVRHSENMCGYRIAQRACRPKDSARKKYGAVGGRREAIRTPVCRYLVAWIPFVLLWCPILCPNLERRISTLRPNKSYSCGRSNFPLLLASVWHTSISHAFFSCALSTVGSHGSTSNLNSWLWNNVAINLLCGST